MGCSGGEGVLYEGRGLGGKRELIKWERGSEVPFPCLDREHLRAVTVPSPLKMGPQPQKEEERKRPLCSFFSRPGVGSSECEPQTLGLVVGVGK